MLNKIKGISDNDYYFHCLKYFYYLCTKNKILVYYMEHIEKLFNAKRLDIKGILSSPVTVTVKEDGTAFQIYNERIDNNIITHYCKRADRPNTKGQDVCEVEKFIHPSYIRAIKHFNNYIDTIKEYKIINFEIITNDDNHIIKDNSLNDNIKIILLSAYDFNGKSIQNNKLIKLAENLEVLTKKVVFFGRFSNEIVDFLMKNKPDFKSSTIGLDFLSKYKNIEGFVFSFECGDKIRNYKLIDPEFRNAINEHLILERKDRERYNCTYSYKLINNYIVSNKVNMSEICKSSNNPCIRIFDIFKRLYKIMDRKEWDCISSEINGIPLINNTKFNISYIRDNHYLYYEFSNNCPYNQHDLNILKFMLYAFMNKRSTYPLWTDILTQSIIVDNIVDLIYKDL